MGYGVGGCNSDTMKSTSAHCAVSFVVDRRKGQCFIKRPIFKWRHNCWAGKDWDNEQLKDFVGLYGNLLNTLPSAPNPKIYRFAPKTPKN